MSHRVMISGTPELPAFVVEIEGDEPEDPDINQRVEANQKYAEGSSQEEVASFLGGQVV